MPAPRFVLDDFWPSDLFLGGIPGAWYDPTDLSTMFQDSAGTTPVTAVEQPVGRILDKSGNGNHASQSTAASRPTYRARYNLLTFSEDYANAAWTKTNVTLTSGQLAPDGTNTAFVLTGTAAYARIESTAVSYAAATYTLSVYVKKASGTMAIAFSNAGSSDEVAFDIGTGTVGTKGANVSSASVQDAGAWWRLVAVSTRTAASQPIRIFAGYPTNISPIVWGAQLLTAADVTATGNAYQRIAAATVYDTAPVFRPYLAFDGMDDSLSTAAINFTSTDKMTVFSGVTKSSDAATGALAEISADAGTNNGAWLLAMPTGAAALAFNWAVRGTASVANAVANSLIAPATAVLACTADITAPSSVTRKNAAIVQALVTSLGTGSFGNYQLFVGRRNNSLIPFNGRLYSLIVRGAASSVTEIADTELWVNARTGAY